MLLGRPLGGHRMRPSAPPAAPTELAVDGPHLTVRLAPGAGVRLTLGMKRYTNQPTFAFPWV